MPLEKGTRRPGTGCHELDAQRRRAGASPAIWSGRRRATSPSRRAIPTRCARRCSPATCCWSKATTTSPASSSISPSRPGRMPRSMSGRSASAPPRTASRWCWSRPILGEGVVGAPLSKYCALPHPHLPADRPDRRRPRAGLHLRGRAHRLRLRREEHHRPDALPVSAAGAAALAAAHDGARLRPSDPHHLLGADRAGVRARALSDPAEDHAAGEREPRARKFSKSAIRRSTRRAISTSRRISSW